MSDSTGTVFDKLDYARRVLRTEATALEVVAGRLDDGFGRVADELFACRGRVAVIGVGKSADVGQKIVGTFNSTGTRAYTLDATRAVHGDLGSVHPDDVALLLSHSGESEELIRLLGPLKKLASSLVAITSSAGSTLGRAAVAAVVYGPIKEACPLALAPSSSTTVMLALGDALAFTLLEQRQFTADEFAKFHPAGSLGRKLAVVSECMRYGAELRIAAQTDTVREVFAKVRHTGRRTGAIMLVDAGGRLAGLFTDSDLARLFENREDRLLDAPIANVMTHAPVVIGPHARVSVALDVLKARKFSELPVVDEGGKPVGMLDITDLIGLDPLAGGAESRPTLRVVERKSA
ncbi:family protein : KpsF/GutQ family protein OS=Isosphaera pallida (strain ATCC 43644 / DSM 9630 / IS1B) GN=Isop_0131 PE=4 SV=1: SIS: CBS: CBS [Gemmata massiliana]|uniref:KpsF/GutQ family sugar-phosphate isomerase n=1 Tax=Gemmata massiliana TaxID=1210884 RepID=A0A6P2CVF5_9BACT|nr:KpsF/GutQ family sugar-phosphate isomerase [Gemmata massiliana]VTR92577.1 family protein : KpsF/GutQ family protein OS=Isosphaera pallida (strain ATCC 43644 / DSM 9630 / IS1B) GN=Isop_0131 PE=4 SV=1: SIS: CBS: CBS [Gemmata massiliana]